MKLARYLTRNMLKTGFSVDVNFIKIRDKGKWIRHCLWMYLVIGFCLPKCEYDFFISILPKSTTHPTANGKKPSKVSELMLFENVYTYDRRMHSILHLQSSILSIFFNKSFVFVFLQRKKQQHTEVALHISGVHFIHTDCVEWIHITTHIFFLPLSTYTINITLAGPIACKLLISRQRQAYHVFNWKVDS